MASWPMPVPPAHVVLEQHEADTNLDDVEVGNHWILRYRIGAGTFGEIYRAIDSSGGKDVAVKVESSKQRQPQLFTEYKVYKSLQGVDNISEVYFHGSLPRHNYMVMELHGPSLEEVFVQQERKFTMKTVLLVAIQLLKSLMDIHDREYIHRDIKPENFLIGTGPRRNKIFTIDLGLARKWTDSRTKKHIAYSEGHNLTGTARYASLRNHLGAQQSRRDDMESLGYMLVYFGKGSLPWQGAKPQKNGNKAQYEHIAERKIGIPVSVLCNGFPDEFVQFFQHIKSLGFEDRPDYEKFLGLFTTALHREGHSLDDPFDWEEVEDSGMLPPPPIDIPSSTMATRHPSNVTPMDEQSRTQSEAGDIMSQDPS